MVGKRSEKFQEAFERFERVVDVKHLQDYKQLVYSFERWAGFRGPMTNRQLSALEYEASTRRLFEKRCSKKPKKHQHFVITSWIKETVKVRGKSQIRFRDKKTGQFIKNPLKQR